MANEGIAYADIRADITKLDADLEQAKAKIEAAFAEIEGHPVQLTALVDTGEATAQLETLESTAAELAATPIVLTPVIDPAEAEAGLSSIQATAEELTSVPVVITPVVDPEPAIVAYGAITAAAEESAAAQVAATEAAGAAQKLADAEKTLAVEAGGARDAIKGIGGAAREFTALANGSVSGAARAGGASLTAMGSGAGLAGLAIGTLAVGLPVLVHALSGGVTAEEELTKATDSASVALDKNTNSLLKNKDAITGIRTEADAAKVAQDNIDQALLNVASTLDDKVKRSADDVSKALGSIGKSPIDIEPTISAIQNLSAAQLASAQDYLQAVGLAGSSLSARTIAEARAAASQIAGITDAQVISLANLATGANNGANSIDRINLAASGLSTKEIDSYVSAIKTLEIVANNTDLSQIIDQGLAIAAGQSDDFNTALKAAEGFDQIRRSTGDADKAQKLYADTIKTYADIVNDKVAADKANKDATNNQTAATKAADKASQDLLKSQEGQQAVQDQLAVSNEVVVIGTDLYAQSLKDAAAAAKDKEAADKAQADAVKQAADAEKQWESALSGLLSPAEQLADSLSLVKQELDGLSGTKVNLEQANETVTRFFADLNGKKNKDAKFNIKVGFDTGTVGGANNFDLLLKGLDDFKTKAVAVFGATGDAQAATKSYSDSLQKLKDNFVSGGATPAARAALAKQFDDEIAGLHLTPAEVALQLQGGAIAELQSQIGKIPDSDTKVQLGILLDQGDTADVQKGLDALKNDPATGSARVAQIFAQAEKAKADADLTAFTEKDRQAAIEAQMALEPAQSQLSDFTNAPRNLAIEADANTAPAAADIASFVSEQAGGTVVTLPIKADTAQAQNAVNDFINANDHRTIHIGTTIVNASGGYRRFDTGGLIDNGNLPSHYAVGDKDQTIYGEPSTGGEFFLSMAPQYAELNKRLAAVAVDRLGGRADFGGRQPSSGGGVDMSPVLEHLASMVDRLAEVRDMPPMFVSPVSSEPSHVASKMHWSVQARRRHYERVKVS